MLSGMNFVNVILTVNICIGLFMNKVMLERNFYL